MTRERAKKEIMRIYMLLSPDIQTALDEAIKALEQNERAEDWYKLLCEKLDEQEPCEVSEYDKDHIWYKGGQYISLRRFLEVKAEAEKEPCENAISIRKDALKTRVGNIVAYNVEWLKKHWQMEMDIVCGVKPCEDAIRREDALTALTGEWTELTDEVIHRLIKRIKALPSVTPSRHKGHCKDCKYFEYDSVAKVDGIPLIVAHEICNKWGDGCKTKEDGYCFLFEPQESEDKE